MRSVVSIESLEGTSLDLFASARRVWGGPTTFEVATLGLGDGNREGFAEKVEALDGERPKIDLPAAGASFLDAALSVDALRL